VGQAPVTWWVMTWTLAAVSWVSSLGLFAATDWAQALPAGAIGASAAVALIWRLVTDHRITEERDQISDRWERIAEAERERADQAEQRALGAESGRRDLAEEVARLHRERGLE